MGGSHMNYLVDQICEKLIATVKKKTGKGGFNIKPFQVKPHLWVFANTLIENPTFDSQTKENMTLRKTAFGSTCELSEKYIKQVQDCGILENIMNWVKFKSEAQLNKKTFASKHSRLKGIPKLDDANDAGTKHSRDCTLIVTEGDSAKALAMSGLSVVGRDKYGVFPLKGKPLNVRDASHKQIMDNAEIGNLLKIIGLQFGKKYESEIDMKNLRYGRLMIMADQDIDGSHIKGLVINFIHAHWPGLLKLPFLEEFITPIVKVLKGNQIQTFFSIPEFEEWKRETSNHRSWRIKYYKGLGTSTSKEGKEYFSNMQRHRIIFEYDGPSCDQALVLAFSKKLANDRKNWLNHGMAERKMRREAELPEIYLYEKDTRTVTYRDFVNKELILFSNTDNERSIPSLVDGMKPGQRKVLFTCFKRNDKHEVKVAQLAGSVSELSAYHHGEMSLMGTIVNLAQNYVGSNNLNLLVPHGQFGTRHMGGKDSASPRYICTMLSSLTRLIFPVYDDHVLNFLFEDNQRIEPEWYCPIIPMCLVNGAEGIGTGYSTKVSNHDVREVVANVRRMINGEEPLPMLPCFKNFNGDILETEEAQKYTCNGIISIIDETTIEISELPIRTWTQNYKELMDSFLYGNDKIQACITDYREHHTDVTVRFTITMTPEQLAKAEKEGLHKKFKLAIPLSYQNQVLFDEYGCLKKYKDSIEIMKEFYTVRLRKYKERKEFLKGMLQAEADKLENQARFILGKIEGKILIENRTKRDVITTLVEKGFLSDPVKAWKSKITKDSNLDDDESEAPVTDYASSTSTASGGPDFQYLLSMAIMSLSKEKKDDLLRQRDEKKDELEKLKSKAPEQVWLDDLDAFCKELEIVEEQERLDEQAAAAIVKKAARGGQSRKGKKVQAKSKDIIKKAFEKKTKEPSKAALKKVKDEFGFETDSVKSEETTEKTDASSVPTEIKDEEPMSLADRLKKKKKQTMLSFKPKTNIPTAEISDDDDDEFKIENFSDNDEPIDIPKRETRKKPAPKYVIDDDDDDDDDDNDDDDSKALSDDDDDDEDYKDDDDGIVGDSDNSEVAETRALIKRLSPKKKNLSSERNKKSSPPPSPAVADSSEEPITIVDSPAKTKKKQTKATKKQPTAKKTATKKEDPKQKKLSFAGKKGKATEDSEKPMSSPTKKKKTNKSAATKRKPISDDDDDDDVKEPTKKTESKRKAAAAADTKAKKPKRNFITFDDDDDDSFHVDVVDNEPAPVARERTGRRVATSKKVYKFSSDEDDDDDGDNFC